MKNLNSNDLIDELQEKSVFFRAEPGKSSNPNGRTVERSNDRGSERKKEQPNGRTNERTNKRKQNTIIEDVNTKPKEREVKRYSFEIYIDQEEEIMDIQNIYFKKTRKRLAGSRIIREALDQFLPELRKAIEE